MEDTTLFKAGDIVKFSASTWQITNGLGWGFWPVGEYWPSENYFYVLSGTALVLEDARCTEDGLVRTFALALDDGRICTTSGTLPLFEKSWSLLCRPEAE